MFLILCGDPKQDQQENSHLKIIMIYFGMQLINMTSTKLQNKHRERPFISHQNDPCDDFDHDPEEYDSTDDQNQDEPSPYSVFQSSFNSMHQRSLPKFLFPTNSGESSQKLPSRW